MHAPTKRQKHAVLAVLALLAVVAGATPVAAQENSTNVTVEAGQSTPAGGGENAQVLDPRTEIVRASYNEEKGVAILVIESDDPQAVTLTDAGGVWSPGQINQVRKVVPSGKSTLRIAVTETDDGRVGVTVAIESGLYAVPISSSSSIFSGSPTWRDAQLSGFAGFLGGIGVVALIARQRVRQGRKEVERVL
ncbi:hypothetical protein [Halorarius halobius]|uniref:hypothetical protein n=1 Tax=Halorarius halobius TaxID=2962671 RepID=UPI0020CF7EC3|nr:hypothetical protein [Halorarius halobius]